MRSIARSRCRNRVPVAAILREVERVDSLMTSEGPRAALLEPIRSGDVYLQTVVLMSTRVTIQVAGHGADPQDAVDRRERVDRAFEWFRRVEACCTRFDPHSELMQLTAQIGVPVPVSALLYEAVQFAVAVAEETEGAFDPTIGHSMETRGFNREYRSGQSVQTGVVETPGISYRDVELDPARRTITLARPLVLDLG